MLRTNYPKNITASCTNCTKLLFCRLKNDIQHPTILVCDFAKEGCVKYEGEGKQTRGLPRREFSKYMKSGKPMNIDVAREMFACSPNRMKVTLEVMSKYYNIKEENGQYTMEVKIKRKKRKNGSNKNL